jgi:serine/threonine-protein kinase
MIGRKINNYEIVSLLGEGGMGAVYVATHPILNRQVAIKVLKREFAEDAALVARFMNEARAASAIHQPNIIEIFDVGTLPEGIPYLMMQLLEGESLAARLHRDKRLAPEDALPIAIQAATALAAAHAKQIVHRDLKPDNLFLVPDENAPRGQRVVVLDFGIAKLRGELSSGSVQTHTGSVMGTPPYMSPEQCRGLVEEIDHRTDIYALGIIVHEMLSGAPPFVSAGFGDLLIMHITKPPPPLRTIVPNLPAAVEAVVLRALEKSREARFASMAELKGALAAAGGQPVTSPYGGRGRGPEGPEANRPRTISTLTSTTGEMLAVDPEHQQATVPMRRSARKLAIGLALGGGALVATIVVGAGLGTSKRSAAPTAALTAAPAPNPAAPPPATSPPAPPPVAAPSPALAPAPAVVAPALEPEPEQKEAASPSKHAAPARASHTKNRAAHSGHAAAVASPSTPTAPPPTPAAVTPPPKPTPKLSADKW